MKQCLHTLFAALAAIALAANSAWAIDDGTTPPHVMKGNILKYSQPIQHVIDPDPMLMDFWGEDIPSDFDWKKLMQQPHDPGVTPFPPNWIIADDFQDDFDTPVLTVRWWGSYVGPTYQGSPTAPIPGPIGPGAEDGYVISFFKNIPAGDAGTGGDLFSKPGDLLGTYVLPLEKVWVEPTTYIGWDQHQIFEYKANLMDAHLDHPSDQADQMGFHQRPGEIYWISISAFVGHKPVLVTDPASGEVRWEFEETGKFSLEEHFWGWHTSPSPSRTSPRWAICGCLTTSGSTISGCRSSRGTICTTWPSSCSPCLSRRARCCSRWG